MSLATRQKEKLAAAGTGLLPVEVGDRVETEANGTNLRCFLGRVLPENGNYCLFLARTKSHVWAESLDDLVALTEDHIDEQGVYFGTAAYKTSANRKQTNVESLKSFRLDIDAGAKKHAKDPAGTYQSKEDAEAALEKFIEQTGLKPSLVVSSGEGLHVYFCLDEAVAPATWLPLATGLGQLAVDRGLRVDPTVTTDTARILRPPGTPHSNGERVSVIKETGAVYTLGEFARVVGHSPAQASDARWSVERTFTAAQLAINDELSLGFGWPPSSALKIVQYCRALRKVAETGGDVPEPEWRAGLGVIKHTVEGLDLAQEWSSGYPGYDEAEVERKFDAWTTGPTTCSEFAKHSTACASCEYAGKIRSPIVLGYEEAVRTAATPSGAYKPTRAQLEQHLPDWRVKSNGKPSGDGGFEFEKVSPHNTTANVRALANLSSWSLRYNVMTKRTELTRSGVLSPRDDHENAALAFFGDLAVTCGMARNSLMELVDAAAGENQYHPALEWITSKPWDGVSRLEQFYETLELSDPRKARLRDRLLDGFMLQGIGALVEPHGIAAQYALVLAGPQDAFKTRWVSNLCPIPGAVRTGLHIDPLNKDSVLTAVGSWISEMGELDSTMRRSDVSALKAFLTRDEDILRPAYARRENVYRRRTVFVGTVNGTGFLADDTGNRRYGVLSVLRCHLLAADVMQQVWAEYLAKYQSGARWHLDAETKSELNASNIDHTAVDPLRERIATRFDWASVEWGSVDPENWRGYPKVAWKSATEVCFAIGIDRPTRGECTRVGSIVRDLQRVSDRVSGATVRVSPEVIHRKSNGTKLLGVPATLAAWG